MKKHSMKPHMLKHIGEDKMNNDIFKSGIDAYEFMVYSYLVMKADREEMTCYPTAGKIFRVESILMCL